MRTPPIRRDTRRERTHPTRRTRACPLPLWRTRGPSAITAAEVRVLADAISATAILHEPRWPAARAGDSAAAAAVAIDRIHRQGPEGPLADLVMGNLVVLARRDGDATARVILAHALRSLARRYPGRTDLHRIADGWAGRHGGACRRVASGGRR
ncbi:hypothetical protein [Methylobacterium oryzae]|uniref:Uncharacterized protein n=1 Tax=Methylobacterium oryzae TaxID=334852 RepID=A0ABU7TU79_9HYPH